MIRKYAFILLTIIFSVCSAGSQSEMPAKLHIFSSGNIMGYLTPCGWGSSRSGGLARRATYVKDHSAGNEHVLILDYGDFISGRTEDDELKAKYLAQGFAALNYDAINLGERDFMLGAKFLLDMKKKYNLPLISANIFYSDSSTLFAEPYIIKKFKTREYGDIEIQSLKVGIFGITENRSNLIYQKDEPKLVTKDPIKIAKHVVEKLSGKCDVIIALAHLSTAQINMLTNEVKGIDVVIGGHDYNRKAEAEMTNGAIVNQTGYKGQYLGDIKINFDENKKVASFENKTILLDQNIKDDPKFSSIISQYDKEYKEYLKQRTSSSQLQ